MVTAYCGSLERALPESLAWLPGLGEEVALDKIRFFEMDEQGYYTAAIVANVDEESYYIEVDNGKATIGWKRQPGAFIIEREDNNKLQCIVDAIMSENELFAALRHEAIRLTCELYLASITRDFSYSNAVQNSRYGYTFEVQASRREEQCIAVVSDKGFSFGKGITIKENPEPEFSNWGRYCTISSRIFIATGREKAESILESTKRFINDPHRYFSALALDRGYSIFGVKHDDDCFEDGPPLLR